MRTDGETQSREEPQSNITGVSTDRRLQIIRRQSPDRADPLQTFAPWRLCVSLVCLAWILKEPGPTSVAADTSSRPNIILLMADDQGNPADGDDLLYVLANAWQRSDTGYAGHPHLKTPHLDAMAADGLRFDRFYSAAPVCSPTRGSVLTGRHPYRYGIYSANVGHMKPQEITLAEILQKQGYVTGHFGKWHLGTLTKIIRESNRGGPKGVAHFAPPRQHGFLSNFSTEAKVPTWDPMLRPLTARGNNWWNPAPDPVQAKPYGTHYWSRGKLIKDNLAGDDSRVIMDRAIPFIRDATQQKKPFFAAIWFHSSHLPVVAGPKYAAMYSQFDGYTRSYYGCITAMDEQIGRLRRALADLGAAGNTMLWYCADNGPEGNDKAPGKTGGLRGRKRSLYEGGVRVPGLLVWPDRIESTRRTSIPCVTSDYLPTVLDCLGLNFEDDRPIDGISLMSVIDDDAEARRRPIGFESAGMATWLDNRFKLVMHVTDGPRQKKRGPTGRNALELYDVPGDPSETKNIADDHPKVVERMVSQLEAWRRSCRRSDRGEDYPKR